MRWGGREGRPSRTITCRARWGWLGSGSVLIAPRMRTQEPWSPNRLRQSRPPGSRSERCKPGRGSYPGTGRRQGRERTRLAWTTAPLLDSTFFLFVPRKRHRTESLYASDTIYSLVGEVNQTLFTVGRHPPRCLLASAFSSLFCWRWLLAGPRVKPDPTTLTRPA